MLTKFLDIQNQKDKQLKEVRALITKYSDQISEFENISLKIADSLSYPLTLNSLRSSISTYNVGTLQEIGNLNLHDFGLYLQLEPEEEEKAQLEQNIQMAIQQGGIDLEEILYLCI